MRRRVGAFALTVGLAVTSLPLIPSLAQPAAADPALGAWGWGSYPYNIHGQVGRGTIDGSPIPTAVAGLGTGTGVLDVAAGGYHSLGVMDDGRVFAWGLQQFGALGNGSQDVAGRGTPVPVTGLGLGSGVVAVAAGSAHSLALTASGAVLAWGYNDAGQLGDGTTVNRATPTAVVGFGSGVVSVSGGMEHSLAAKSDGSVWAFGSNLSAELGGFVGTQSLTPVQVLPPGSGVVQVSAGFHHSLARTADGTVWQWGNDGWGPGEAVNNIAIPYVVPTLESGVVDIDGGGNYSLAAKSDGAMVGWGLGHYGRRCSANTDDVTTPAATDFGPGSGVIDVEAGGMGGSTLVRLADGSVFGCGYNGNNELGNGLGGVAADGAVTVLSPTLVAGFVPGSGATDIAVGQAHGLAIAATPIYTPITYEASIGDVVVREGDLGNRTAAATITLDHFAFTKQTVKVTAYSTTAGTGDYVAFTNRVVTIPAGAASATVSLSFKGDDDDEGDETVSLGLTGSPTVTVDDGIGEVTIVDDDGPSAVTPELSVGDIEVYESNGNTTKVSFTVALSAASAAPVTTNYTTIGWTATLVADFAKKTNVALTFPAGVRFKLVTILVNNDYLGELDEVFLLSITNVVGATVSDSLGVATITNDDF